MEKYGQEELRIYLYKFLAGCSQKCADVNMFCSSSLTFSRHVTMTRIFLVDQQSIDVITIFLATENTWVCFLISLKLDY